MKKFNNKLIANSLFAIVSGILTNTIYNELCTSYFKQNITEDGIIFIEVNKLSLFEQVSIIILMFSFIWLVLAVLFPEIYLILKRKIQFRQHRLYTNKEIVNVYNRVKKDVLNSIDKYNLLQSNCFEDNYDSLMIASDIFSCINDLYIVFNGKSKIQKNTIHSVFRNGTTVNDINKKISIYEYEATLKNISILLNHISDNTQLQGDYEKITKRLDELKNIYE